MKPALGERAGRIRCDPLAGDYRVDTSSRGARALYDVIETTVRPHRDRFDPQHDRDTGRYVALHEDGNRWTGKS
jgi:hypothetical protein